MPFGTFLPLPGSSDPAPPPLRPEAAPPLDASSSAGPQGHILRLDELPQEIVLRVAHYLSPGKALALAAASQSTFAMLRTDIVEVQRLGGRIRWVSGLSAFEAALADLLLVPTKCRDPLVRALGERLPVLPEPLRGPAHQALQPYVRACATPTGQDAGHGSRPEWHRLVDAGIAGDPQDLLHRILASPADARAALVEAWVGSDVPPPPPVSLWPRILDALPAPARAAVLATMAQTIPDAEYGKALQIIITAVQASVEGDGFLPADLARTLARLAGGLGWQVSNEVPARLGQYWDEVFGLARRLPLPAQPEVMSQLATLVHADDAPSPADDAAKPRPRWSGFIGYVSAHFAPADATRILGDLAQASSNAEDGERHPHAAPLSRALCKAAMALPDTWCAKLLAIVLDCAPADELAALALWEEGLRAGEPLAASVAAPLYTSLARSIRTLPASHQAACWDALCHCLETHADIAPLTPAMLELARHAIGSRSLERRTLLLRTAGRLPAEDRGRLCAAMTMTSDITPALWRAQVMDLESLPLHVRHRTAAWLSVALFGYQTGPHGFRPALTEPFLPDPGGLAAAEYPRNAAQALDRLSDILVLLPLADRGAVLVSLSRTGAGLCVNPLPWSAARVNWLLREVMKLAPLHHHGLDVVTNVAHSAARQCPSEAEALAVFSAFHGAVAALPADARVSALFHLTAMMQRLVKDQRALQAINPLWVGLPASDLMPLRTRKRKEPPEGAAD